MKTRTFIPMLKSGTPVARRYSTLSATEKAAYIMRHLLDNKAENVVGLDVSGAMCADVIICATANSSRHARSLADAVASLAHEKKYEWLRMEGYQNGEWVLADMNDIIVNIFLEETREAFNIEELWKNAKAVSPAKEVPHSVKLRGLNPTLLLILDGYGIAPDSEGNAATHADTPHIDSLLKMPECVRLEASGRSVGLPQGFMGNSEVGHLNIGAGRIVYQDMTRIDMAIEDGSIAQNPVFSELIQAVKTQGGRLHLAGLLSDGGVHSHINHLKALISVASEAGVPVIVHAFTDGRDTPPMSAVKYVQELMPVLEQNNARLGSLCGRFYAMDRDKRWERVERAWNMLVHGKATYAENALEALQASYNADIKDEFIEPVLLGSVNDVCIRSGDGLFMFNFRADRGRELASAFALDDFIGFDRGDVLQLAGLASMTSYDASLPLPVAFEKKNITNTIGEVASKHGMKQLRIAETEKYAHVTYFLNGGREEPFEGEERILVNSPKDVATYDLKPEMSAFEVTDKLLEAWQSGKYKLIVCNLANPDMVGHTGVFPAALKALEAVDICVGRIADAVKTSGGNLFLFADHGNIEMMKDSTTGQPHTAHTTNPVPFAVIAKGRPLPLTQGGKLADIAPTLLDLLGIEQPQDMDGHSLLDLARLSEHIG